MRWPFNGRARRRAHRRFFDAPTITPAIDAEIESCTLIGDDETAIVYRGVGAFFITNVGGLNICEAVAIKGLGVASRHAWLLARARELFGDGVEIAGRGLQS